MKIDARCRGLETSDSFREHVRRRVHFQMSRFGGAVRSIVVRIGDIGHGEPVHCDAFGTLQTASKWFSTHPQTHERVERLLAMARSGRRVAHQPSLARLVREW